MTNRNFANLIWNLSSAFLRVKGTDQSGLFTQGKKMIANESNCHLRYCHLRKEKKKKKNYSKTTNFFSLSRVCNKVRVIYPMCLGLK